MKKKSSLELSSYELIVFCLGFAVALGTFGAVLVNAQETGNGTCRIDFHRKTQTKSPNLETPKIEEESGVLLLGTQVYELRLPDTTQAYSTQTKTLVTLDHAKREHVKFPMHALVWFFNSETAHRNALCHASQAAELSLAEMEPCSRFEVESLFSYSHPQALQLFDGKPVRIEHRQLDKRHLFENEGKLAVSLEPSTHSLHRDHGQMFRRFLAHICKIHPDIRSKIIDLGVLPTELYYRTREGTTETTVEYRFVNIQFEREPLSFEVPKDFQPVSNDARLEALLAKLETTTIPSQKDLLSKAEKQIDEFLSAHRTEDAVLTAHRFYLVTDSDQGFRDLLMRCGGMGDRNIRRLVYGLSNLREIKELKVTLESKDSPMAYLLDYYLADLAMGQHRNDEPIQESLIECLEKDELIVGAYVDLWRRYLQDWDPYTAWRCIQAARRIAPDHSALILVNQMERMIEHDSPDFF